MLFCVHCSSDSSHLRKHGRFLRPSDKRTFQRYKCLNCNLTQSDATTQSFYRQKKRHLHQRLVELLCSGVSQRRSARILKISRTTVVRKFILLAHIAKQKNIRLLTEMKRVQNLQFDDLETFEHTKCKPLSVALAVDKEHRKILGFSVSRMPSKGHLAKIALKKYGPRRDERSRGWDDLFNFIKPLLAPELIVESDQNPHYPPVVKRWCDGAIHKTTRSRRACVTGQGELKRGGFDPLFSLNHTFAMCRANINRLFRKTWCTTKRPDRLAAHLELYAYYHNQKLTA
jgi:transposase-like protein